MKPFHTISSRDYRYSIFFRQFHFWSCFAWSSFHHHGSLTQTSRARERKITPRREWMTSQGSSADDANVIRFHVGSAHPVHHSIHSLLPTTAITRTSISLPIFINHIPFSILFSLFSVAGIIANHHTCLIQSKYSLARWRSCFIASACISFYHTHAHFSFSSLRYLFLISHSHTLTQPTKKKPHTRSQLHDSFKISKKSATQLFVVGHTSRT